MLAAISKVNGRRHLQPMHTETTSSPPSVLKNRLPRCKEILTAPANPLGEVTPKGVQRERANRPNQRPYLPLPIALDQRIGGTVVFQFRFRAWFCSSGNNVLGQRTCPSSTPHWSKRIDVPNHALREDAVFVERHQLAQRFRRRAGRRKSCSMAGCPRKPGAGTKSSFVPSTLTSSAVLPKASASACANTLAMRMSWWRPQRRERVHERDEIARDQPGTLVDQLVKGMLPVGAGLAPVDRSLSGNPPPCPSSVTCLPLLSIVNCCK